MNPGFYINITSYQNARTFMDVVYTSLGSGVVPALGPVNYGLASLTYSATGILTAVFNERAHGLLNWNLNVHQASYSKTGACFVKVTGVSLSTNTVTMLVVDAAGDAVAPAAGDILHLTFEWQLASN